MEGVCAALEIVGEVVDAGDGLCLADGHGAEIVQVFHELKGLPAKKVLDLHIGEPLHVQDDAGADAEQVCRPFLEFLGVLDRVEAVGGAGCKLHDRFDLGGVDTVNVALCSLEEGDGVI